jgi:alanyl-tRNA synthetase
MLAHELRQKYIEFFESKGHLHLPGSPLVPINALGTPDNSTLFTSAGMQQFKPYFTGEATPPRTRICTVQKCLRTVDLDSVGDFSHCTFFEMLGNFSFGDYFKQDVIPWTWEFLTEWLHIDPDRLCVTVYEEDDEAFTIWRDMVGLPEDRIHRMGEDKNYWPANAISSGPDGPCGPCSEIFYRMSPLEEMCSDPGLTSTERYRIDDTAGRWLEIWNNVFTQFNRSETPDGKPLLTPLPRKNNDTGAGLDRIAFVIQGKRSVFETDLFAPALARIEELSGVQYAGSDSKSDFAFRVVAEHIRSMVFCIADGILPSNEGRGYVLRRIMRRAIRFGRSVLGFEAPFLHEVAPCIIEQMGDFYTELVDRREHILKTVLAEEERFRHTLDNGMSRLEEMLGKTSKKDKLSGENAFTLYDTFGFPLELTEEICAEKGVQVDMDAFEKSMKLQRERSREAAGIEKDVFRAMGEALSEVQRNCPPTQFLGYTSLSSDAKILAIVKDGELIDFLRPGEEADVILDQTPAYAESGGQVGDTGWIIGADGDVSCALKAAITDTQKSGSIFLHHARVEEGELTTDMPVLVQVDEHRRRNIMRNHTATHLLQAALREVLGSHVHQKGSMVSPDRLRFDFTHTQPLSADEIQDIEDKVNADILNDMPVEIHTDVSLADARAKGAMALFGEKYGDRVRMVEVPGCSLELCGGTHLTRTSQAGLFHILSETGVAAGVRRIEAVTGENAYKYQKEQEETLEKVAHTLKSNTRDVLIAAEKLVAQRNQLEKQLQQLRTASSSLSEFTPKEINGVKFISASVGNTDSATLAAMIDNLSAKQESAVIVLGGTAEGKVFFAIRVTPDLVKRGFHAGSLIREVAKAAGGGGGGRPDFAQAGGREPDKLDEALLVAERLVTLQTEK